MAGAGGGPAWAPAERARSCAGATLRGSAASPGSSSDQRHGRSACKPRTRDTHARLPPIFRAGLPSFHSSFHPSSTLHSTVHSTVHSTLHSTLHPPPHPPLHLAIHERRCLWTDGIHGSYKRPHPTASPRCYANELVNEPPLQPTIAPGEPAFIRRLPKGVEYTHIKTIFMDLPSALTTLLWSLSPRSKWNIVTAPGASDLRNPRRSGALRRGAPATRAVGATHAAHRHRLAAATLKYARR